MKSIVFFLLFILSTGAVASAQNSQIDALIRAKVCQSASGAAVVHAAPISGRRAKGLRFSVWF